MSETSAPYTHVAEPEDVPETVSFSNRRRRVIPSQSSSRRVCLTATMAFILLASIVLLVYFAVAKSSGGGGGGGHLSALKCESFPAWNLSARQPDPSVRRPEQRTYAVDQHYVHLVILDHLELSELRVNGALDHYFRYRVPELLFTAQLLRHSPSLWNESFHVELTAELISLYLRCPETADFYCPTPIEQQQLVDAIAMGAVTFGSFPLTVESDLLDPALMRFGLDWSARLAHETGRSGGRSVTMTLTDVQGVTRGLVPQLNASNVTALLLSTDERLRPLSVPPLFQWSAGEGEPSTVVLYQPRLFSCLNASDAITFPNFNHVLLIDRVSSTNDSAFTPHLMLSHLAHVQAQFPSSIVLFSTLDEFVGQLTDHGRFGRVQLPQVHEEIGSSSVIGVASDPLLLASFLNLRELRARCINDSACDNCSRSFFDFSRFLLAAAHPVQGGNVSDFLHPLQDMDRDSPYWAWNNTQFDAVRDLPEVRALERSWSDSRAWSVNESLRALPADHPVRASFSALLNGTLIPAPTVNLSGLVESPLLPGFDTGDYLVSFSTAGSLVSLIDKASSTNYASSDNPLGLFLYAFYSEADYNASLSSFLACGINGSVQACDASTLVDYSKLGLDSAFHSPALPNRTAYSMSHFYVQNDTNTPSIFLFNLTLPSNTSALHTDVGAPTSVILRYQLCRGALAVNVTLYNASTTRVPEASFVLFHPRPSKEGGDQLEVRKVGEWVVEEEAAHVGNSSVNGWGVQEARVDGYWELKSEDAGLMVREVTVLPRMKRAEVSTNSSEVQVAVCLHTNVWSREHAQWYPFDEEGEERERNSHYRFLMRLQ